MPQPANAPGTFGGWVTTARGRLRGGALLLLTMPLLLEALVELGRGRPQQTAAAAAAFGLVLLAVLRLRRDRSRRASMRAALRVGLAAALIGAFGAEYDPVMTVFIAAAAGIGTLLAYGPAGEAVLPDLVPVLTPAEAPPPNPDLQALTELTARATALAGRAGSLPPGPFSASIARVAAEAEALLSEAREDPTDLVRVRRFLVVFLDQAEALCRRYQSAHPEGGALAPDLAQVLADLERAFAGKRQELRQHDLQALDVEREVLARRLAEQLTPPRSPPQESPQ